MLYPAGRDQSYSKARCLFRCVHRWFLSALLAGRHQFNPLATLWLRFNRLLINHISLSAYLANPCMWLINRWSAQSAWTRSPPPNHQTSYRFASDTLFSWSNSASYSAALCPVTWSVQSTATSMCILWIIQRITSHHVDYLWWYR